MKAPPSASEGSSTGSPGSTNWGRKLVKNTAIFGFRRLLSRPSAKGVRARRRDPVDRVPPESGPQRLHAEEAEIERAGHLQRP